jgi:hypothetical protein
MCRRLDNIIKECDNSPKLGGMVKRLQQEAKNTKHQTNMLLDTAKTLETIDFA